MAQALAEQQSSPAARWQRWLKIAAVGRHPRRTLARICVLVAASYLVFGYVLRPVRVEGISMMPTYQDHSINFCNRLAYLFHEPRRGDVVTVRLAGLRVMYMKRVVGLPGETISFRRGKILIDGVVLPEPYEKYPCHWNLPPVRLGAEDYFVVGDNRSMPPQDHEFGKTDRYRIVGRVML